MENVKKHYDGTIYIVRKKNKNGEYDAVYFEDENGNTVLLGFKDLATRIVYKLECEQC